MAIIFFEQQKKQQILLMVFAVVFVLTLALLWFGVFQKPKPALGPTFPERKLEIDLGLLEEEKLKKLAPFVEIQPLEISPGRENPFLPY
jgi:hypothetical protein